VASQQGGATGRWGRFGEATIIMIALGTSEVGVTVSRNRAEQLEGAETVILSLRPIAIITCAFFCPFEDVLAHLAALVSSLVMMITAGVRICDVRRSWSVIAIS